LLHFLQRNAFDPQCVKDAGLLQGFSDAGTNAAAMSDIVGGVNQVSGRPPFFDTFAKEVSVLGVGRKLAGLLYISHRQTLPFEHGKEFAQRLRQDRVDDSLVFTEDMLSRSLIEQDVAPAWVPRLMAIRFNTINQRYLQRLSE